MKTGILTVTAAMAIAMTWTAPASAGKWWFELFGGGTTPMGEFADQDGWDAEPGYQFGGAVETSVNDQWALGLELSYARNNQGRGVGETVDLGGGDSYRLNSDWYKTIGLAAYTQAALPIGGPLRYEALVGLGMYTIKEEWEETTNSGGVSQTTSHATDWGVNFGAKLGAGARYALNPAWGIGMDVDYNVVLRWGVLSAGNTPIEYVGYKGVLRYTPVAGQ